MRKLILIKHAAPLVIPGKPTEEWKLSEKGRESCVPLAEAVRAYSPSIIVASEEPKASETGRIIAEKLGVGFEEAAGLQEHDRSNVPHMRSGEFISHMELLFRRADERVLGHESADEALTRFENAVDGVLENHAEGNVAIVSHGTVIALLVAEYGGTAEKPFELWRKLGLPSFVVISIPDRQIERIVEKF